MEDTTALPVRDRLDAHVQEGAAAMVVRERATGDFDVDGPAAALKSVRAGRALARWRARDMVEEGRPTTVFRQDPV